MNPEAQAELERILALEPAALTDADRAFLQARRSYLTEGQRINFDVDAAPIEEAAEAPSEEASTEAPRRRGRRATVESVE